MDFAFYSRAKDHVSEKKIQGLGLVKWHWHPLVFIEHEWDTSFGAARKDFFKICLAAVPLRVFIGYGASKHTPTYIASELKDFYKRSQLQQVPEGETLILIGKRRRTRPCEWREIWKLVDQAKQWERLSALDFTNLPFME